MKNIKTSIKIIFLFVTAILMSKIPELFPTFFGDWLCKGSGTEKLTNSIYTHYLGCDYNSRYHNPEWHWGYQHYLLLTMGIVLFIYQIFDIVDKYDND